MEKGKLEGYMEFVSIPASFDSTTVDQRKLLQAVELTQIHTFGWPIGAVIYGSPFSPAPDEDGIRAEIDRLGDSRDGITWGYDFWRLRTDGSFYTLTSLFEDNRSPKQPTIFVDTRTVRTAEVFMRTARLYEALGVSPETVVGCRIEYGGLEGRTLGVASPRRMPIFPVPKCTGGKAERSFQLPLQEYLDPAGLKRVVYEVVKSITMMCDYFDPGRSNTDLAVDAYLQGRVI